MTLCRNSAAELVKQELLFVGQESGKLLAIRDLVKKVGGSSMNVYYTCISVCQSLALYHVYCMTPPPPHITHCHWVPPTHITHCHIVSLPPTHITHCHRVFLLRCSSLYRARSGLRICSMSSSMTVSTWTSFTQRGLKLRETMS